MKRLVTLFLLLLTAIPVVAQNKLAERNPWWWGVDLGGSFQTSDMQPKAGFTFGIQASKFTRVSSPSPIYLGLRFRFIDGRNFGYNYHQLGIQNNPVLGAGATNYANDPLNAGQVYSNYRFRYDEFAAELLIGSNTLRKRGILLYAFGGAGLNYWSTTTNQLDVSGNLYDYTSITDNGNRDQVSTQLDALLDDTYETRADGSTGGAQWSFMPSAGFGLGYEWRAFSFGLEHRTTFALNDVIDGTRFNGAGAATPNNDMFHYTGLFLRWRFGTTSNTNSNTNTVPLPPQPNVNNIPPPNPNTPVVITDPDPNPNPNPNNSNPNTTVLPPPNVDFTTPATNPYTATSLNQQLVVRVTNVLQQSQISLTINGQMMPQSSFNFNPATHVMTFNHTLQPGNNTYYVVATNNAGSDNDSQTIIFKGNQSNGVPPTVNFTNPSGSPVTWTQPMMNITAATQNVPAQANVTISQNGMPVTNFTFNVNSGLVTFPANLQNGNNVYQITVSNPFGTATDVTTILYSPAPSNPKPVVTITTPSACPHSTKNQTMTITATVTNVMAANQVTVLFNGTAVTNFSFALNGTTATISFPVTLNSGVNTLVITGTNAAGSDTENCQITYKPQSPTVTPPVVTITSPSACPHSTKNQTMTITATVTNVTTASQVTVLFNGTAVTNFSFALNGTTATISFPATLNSGVNTLVITGTNSAGSDTENCQITYKPQSPTVNPPVVTITSPSVCPHNTKSQMMTVTATVTNVTAANQVNITFNGTVVQNFTFTLNGNVATVSFPVSLNSGNNTVTITGTNSAGTNTKDCLLVYTVLVPTVNPPVVTITSPSVCPHNTKSQTMTVTATVTNVTAANQVNITFNGTVVQNFTFTLNGNVATVSFPVSLNTGNNTVTITGTNSAGTNTKDCLLVYTVLVPTVNPPVVTITSPSVCPHNTKSQTMTVTATVTNVTAANQVNITFNGTVVQNFTFTLNGNVATVSFPVSLNSGNNTVTITGTNSAGTSTKDCLLVYTVLVPTVNPPVVNYVTPASSPFTSNTPNMTVTATVKNVTAANQVTVSYNNTAVTNFTFSLNGSTATITFPVTLQFAMNGSCVVTGTNSAGTDSETMLLMYHPLPPAVNITNPATSPFTTTSAAFTMTATVLNVNSSNDITVKVNNSTVTNFTYNPSTKVVSLPVTLTPGTTTFVVTAANTTSTATDNASVIFKQAPPRGPRVAITNPASSPTTVSTSSITVTASVQNVASASEITVKRANNSTVNFNYNAGTVTFTDNLNNGANTYTVSASNANGSDSKSTTINYTPTVASSPGGSSVGTPRGNTTPATDPVIILVTPSSTTVSTSDQTYDVTMRTLGVTAASQIVVKVNGVATTNFTYVASTNTLTFTASLTSGANTINVRIQNSIGYAEKELAVTFTAQSRNSGGSSGKPRTTTVPAAKPKVTTTTTTEAPAATPEKPATTTPEAPTLSRPRGGNAPAPTTVPVPPKQTAG